MAAPIVCNYNQTHGFSQRGQGPQSVFMNSRVHHYMRIASSTSQNCGISSYFIFKDIESLAGSAVTKNVDPVILSNICKGLKNENPYCINLHFLGKEAQQRTKGINVVPSKLIGSWGTRAMAVAGEVTRHGQTLPYSWSVSSVSLRSK
jgi:hypothetical protein